MGHRLKYFAVLCAALLVLGAMAGGLFLIATGGGDKPRADTVFKFPGLQGPDAPTILGEPKPTDWQQYGQGSRSRLAVLLTNPDSAWLGIAHGLKTIGVPFIITTDYRQALQHKVVLVYPQISGDVLDAAAPKAFAEFARAGGTLIAVHVLGGGLNELFGFAEAVATRAHYELKFDRSNTLNAAFDDPKEQTIRIAAADASARGGHYEYSRPAHPALAVYEDGTAAITQNNIGDGHVYALGIDIGLLLQTGYNNREEGIARSYVNDFEPTLDVLLRLLRNIYVAGEPDAVTLATVPQDKGLAVMLTHDIDYSKSFANAVTYAQFEREQAVRATYFIQTKYVRDWNDEVFFNTQELPHLQALDALGMEIASHSVSHSGVFNKFPLGNGDERYPSYVPFVRDQQHTDNGSVLGELRVSKFLLEHFTAKPVVTFRPGHLRTPYTAPQALAATGYKFSSSVTANNSLTHLPFQLNHGREYKSETSVFEFPVTIEDEDPPKLGARLAPAVALARRISRYGGSFVVLIHPDIVGHKMEFERGLVDAVKSFSWFGSIADYGQWWLARNGTALDVERDGGRRVVTLAIPAEIAGLTIVIPAGWTLTAREPADLKTAQNGNRIVIATASGAVKLVFRAR